MGKEGKRTGGMKKGEEKGGKREGKERGGEGRGGMEHLRFLPGLTTMFLAMCRSIAINTTN